MTSKKNTNKKLCKELIEEITHSLNNIDGWGSVEVVIQNYKVMQITEKNIRKPSIVISESE